jgi:hypothetical protein
MLAATNMCESGADLAVGAPDPLRAGYPWCRASSQPQKVRFAPDSALEGAVTSELVSATNFPVIQGKYREFHRF